MFEDILLESDGKAKTKKPATVALSLLMQSLAVAAVVLMPMAWPEALPWACSGAGRGVS